MGGLDGNGFLKTYALLMEDKMTAGAFWRTENYGCDGLSLRGPLLIEPYRASKHSKKDCQF